VPQETPNERIPGLLFKKKPAGWKKVIMLKNTARFEPRESL
jgi:hypothetical protein